MRWPSLSLRSLLGISPGKRAPAPGPAESVRPTPADQKITVRDRKRASIEALHSAVIAEPPPLPKASAPAWLAIARGELGVREMPGSNDNPRIQEYLRTTRLPDALIKDETAWCSAFVNWVMLQAGIERTHSAAARSWLRWGVAIEEPRVGCVVVLWRKDPMGPHGHVGLFVSRHDHDGDIVLLGGNQGNRVSMQRYPVQRVLGYRWPRGLPA